MAQFLLNELAAKGPMKASEFEQEGDRRRGPWWDWSEAKVGLEMLFHAGQVAVAGRVRFERVYDLPERRLPAAVLGVGIPKPEAIRELTRRASIAMGVATVRDLADYWRLLQVDVKSAVTDLVDAGELVPVKVQGWGVAAYLHRDARIPRHIVGAALLSPFDPVVWERTRTEMMFGFRYRIEIYTPAPKRIFGYYTLPVLIDDALVARIDLKTDRQAKVLRVQSAWKEPGQTADVERIWQLLRETAAWQGMETVEVMGRGDLPL